MEDEIVAEVIERSTVPRRSAAVASTTPVHAMGASPEHGIEGAQLGPDKNGNRW